MSEEAEALAAELSPPRARRGPLHDNLTSQITAKVELDGRANSPNERHPQSGDGTGP